MTETATVLKLGDTIVVDAALFDTLMSAKLLKQTGTSTSDDGKITWPTWGDVVDEDGTAIKCTLID